MVFNSRKFKSVVEFVFVLIVTTVYFVGVMTGNFAQMLSTSIAFSVYTLGYIAISMYLVTSLYEDLDKRNLRSLVVVLSIPLSVGILGSVLSVIGLAIGSVGIQYAAFVFMLLFTIIVGFIAFTTKQED